MEMDGIIPAHRARAKRANVIGNNPFFSPSSRSPQEWYKKKKEINNIKNESIFKQGSRLSLKKTKEHT